MEWCATIDVTTPTAHKAIKAFSIVKVKGLVKVLQREYLGTYGAFQKDKLKFYADDFYYKFRNNLITAFSTYISDSRNMVYLLNTVGYYTYDDPDATPCPYKLLIGSEKGSTIKDVSSDEEQRQIFFTKKSTDLTQIRTSYDKKGQTFNLAFGYRPLGKIISAPIVLRTRAGGWSGKSLYITTSGFKVKW